MAYLDLLGWLFSLGFTLLIIGGVVGVLLFNHYSNQLPDYTTARQIRSADHYAPLSAEDGKLLVEYAAEKRVFVPVAAIPKLVQQWGVHFRRGQKFLRA